MIRSQRVQIVFILVFVLSTVVFGQDKLDNQDKKLREEILAVYKSEDEKGLRNFVRRQDCKITNKFIADFAKAGVKERKEEWLKSCEVMAEEKKDDKTLADVYLKIGEYFRLVSHNRKATDYFDKALPIYLKFNDPVGQGNVYSNKGDIYLRMGENPRALEMYDKALPLLEKGKSLTGQGYVYTSKGDIYLYTGDYFNAIKMYDNALSFFEKTKYFRGMGDVFHRKGAIYSYTGENSKAMKMYDKSLSFFEKIGNYAGQGNAYVGKGAIYHFSGYNVNALDMYDKALVFFKRARSHLGLGNTYLSKGDVYFYSGDNSTALDMYDKALLFFQKVGNPLGQGNVFRSKGKIYFRIGDNLKALEMCDKAMTFLEKTGNPIGLGELYKSRGDIFFCIGIDSKAIKMYEKSLILYKKGGHIIGRGNGYLRIGEIYLFEGKYSNALEMLDKALVSYTKAKVPDGLGNVYLSNGHVYSTTGDTTIALDNYDKAQLFFEKAGNTIGLGNSYLSKGNIYFYTGDNTKSIEMFNKALFFYEKAGDLRMGSNTLHGKAKVLVKLGKKDQALNLFEIGITDLEKVRVHTAFSDMKRAFMETIYEQYEETVLFMLENNYYEKGFKYAESMRTRVFTDQMAEGLVRLDKGLAPELKEKRDNLMAKLSLFSKEINKTAGGKDEQKLKELKEQYQKAENEFNELLIKIRLENPLYASVRYPQPVTVHELQKDTLKKDEILLRYIILSDKLYAFLTSKESFKTIPMEIKEKEIKNTINRYLQAISENNSRAIKRYGKILYQKLFKPLEAEIKTYRDVIIIPDGELAKIPFESLIIDKKKSGRPVFLLEKYRVRYIQSASLLSILRKHYRRDSETRSFIGFGDPIYDYENFKQGKPEHGTPVPVRGDEITGIHRGKYNREGGELARLTGSGEEVETIAQLFKKANQTSVMHLRAAATEENAGAADMKNFDYIHFSCHGILGDTFQCLVLSQVPGAKEDGYFTLNEIMNCDYNAKLVVLSACRTGTGKMERAEGVMGLTRAVMYAGTPAVVASLWDVDDTAAKELMIHFYKNMLEKNMDKVEALRKTKLDLINVEKYASPYYWSAFIMYGE